MDEQKGSFHHQDKINTPFGEWLFMGMATLAMLVGLPLLIAGLFEFVVPFLGRLWTR